MFKNVMSQEWKGTNIEIINAPKRVELRVDGKTQDYYEGSFVPKGGKIVLEAKGDSGAKVKVVFERSLLIIPKYHILYNGKEIKSGIVR